MGSFGVYISKGVNFFQTKSSCERIGDTEMKSGGRGNSLFRPVCNIKKVYIIRRPPNEVSIESSNMFR